MKISVSMYSLAFVIMKEKWTVMDFIDYAKNNSIDGIELLDIFWKNTTQIDQEIDEVKAALQKYDLTVSAYDVSNDFVKASNREREMEVLKVMDGIRIAKQLGTNIVRIFTGNLQDGVTYEAAQQWIVKGLKKCAVMAEEEKVYLAIENHGLLAGKSMQVKEMIEKVNSPFVKSTFDTGNFLLLDEDPADAFELLKSEIVHVHLKDFRVKHHDEQFKGINTISGKELIGSIPGDGLVDLAYIVKGLGKNSYTGWLSVEFEGPEEAKSATLEAVNRLKELVM